MKRLQHEVYQTDRFDRHVNNTPIITVSGQAEAVSPDHRSAYRARLLLARPGLPPIGQAYIDSILARLDQLNAEGWHLCEAAS